MVEPRGYLAELERSGHEPPIPEDLMLRVFDGYERRKQTSGKIDFEDMLGLAVQMFDRYPAAAAAVRERFHAFTVDEYQDVNPLQEALLDRWLGDREDLCVVGDDYQTIYSFTAPRRTTCSGSRIGSRPPPSSAWSATIAPRPRSSASRTSWPRTSAGSARRSRRPWSRDRRCSRGRSTTSRKRSPPSSRPWASSARTGWRWRRWPSCIASTPAPSRSRRRSPPRASRIRCATVRSCAARGPSRCSSG